MRLLRETSQKNQTMNEEKKSPKERKGCLLKIMLAIMIVFGVSLISALTSQPTQYGRSAPLSPLLSMIACGAIIALWFWKPSARSDIDDQRIKPLDKDESDPEDR